MSRDLRYFGTKCSACLGVILTKEFVMKTMDMVFHLHCFKCSICTTSLNKGYYINTHIYNVIMLN